MKCRRVIFAAIAGLGIAFCLIAGKSLDVDYALDLTQKSFYVSWILGSAVWGSLIYVIWRAADGDLCLKGDIGDRISKYIGKWSGAVSAMLSGIDSRMSILIIMLVLLILWLPAWLSIFPGVFSYDAYDEWMQVRTGNITAHHPVLHVVFLGGIVEGVYQLIGSYNVGIALCTGIQMGILAWTFAYTVKFLKECGVHPLFRIFALLFYGCSPVIQLFAISATKDILYAAAFLLFVISLYRLCVHREGFFRKREWVIVFIVSALLTMIMRNNGLYIVLLTLPLVLLMVRTSQGLGCMKKYIGMCAAVAALYFLYTGPLYNILNVTPGGSQELLSVPLQQLARVYHYERDSFAEEDIAYLQELVPEKNWEAYRSTVADFVKSGFCEEVFQADKGKFFRLWLKTGVKHPLTYISSFLLGTVDYWYPFSVVDGYQDVYGKSSYFDYRVSEPGREIVLLKGIHEKYEAISHDKEAQTRPGMFLILSPGWYLLLFLLMFLYQWQRRRYPMLLVLLPILLNFGTVLLGPIALVRYVLILFYVFPVYSVMLPGDKIK